MKAVIQRVTRAAVRVDGQTIGAIERGLLVLLGIGKLDTPATADWLIKKLLTLRIFPDADGKMNRSVTDIAGGLLIVSQFTLYGVLEKGTRPSFSDAMPPAAAESLYRDFMTRLRAATNLSVAEGRFAATMEVELVNDGPVTIIVERASSSFPDGTVHPTQLNELEARSTTFVAFDSTAPVSKYQRNLPHWEQSGRTYFVTVRLADSLPQEKLERWHRERQDWQRTHPSPLTPELQAEYDQLFTARFQEWLDAGYGECLLRKPALSGIVAEALRHFNGQRYNLGPFVVMPNHLHLLVTPLDSWTLEQILHSWKSYTAGVINQALGRSGQLWQHESFDHLVRNEDRLRQFEDYIRQNPIKVKLQHDEYIYQP